MKKLRIIFLCLSLLLLTACGAQPTSAPPEIGPPLRTVTDAGGRQVELPEEVASVVCVGVGDENAVQVRRGQLQLPESGGDPAAGDAGVDQQVGITAGTDQGVPGGAAGQGMYSGQEP